MTFLPSTRSVTDLFVFFFAVIIADNFAKVNKIGYPGLRWVTLSMNQFYAL
jgi:hypothetical protein